MNCINNTLNLHTAWRRLAQRGLIVWALGACALAAAAPAELNLLDDRAAWTLAPQPGGPSWDGNALRVPALADGNAQIKQALRPVTLGPAASWRAQVRLAAVQPKAADAALGLVLVAPSGEMLGVMLRPQERDLVVIRSDGSNWRAPLTGYVPVPMLAGPATAPHLLDVQSQGSRLRISIDGTLVVTTRLLDFRPAQIGLRASNTDAMVDQWVLQETGQDARLARLAGLLQAPGAQVCFEDKLEASSTASKVAKSLFASVSGLFGSDASDAPSGRKPIDPATAWTASWSEAQSAFTRDTARQRLVLQTKGDDDIAQVFPNSHDPRFFAGVAVQATVNLPVLKEGGQAGVVLAQTFPNDAAGKKADELIFAYLTPTEVLLYERVNAGPNAGKWMLLERVPHGGVAQRPVTLRLVHQAENAWVFLDGQLMIASDNVKKMRINNAGLRTGGVATMEASHFLFGEI